MASTELMEKLKTLGVPLSAIEEALSHLQQENKLKLELLREDNSFIDSFVTKEWLFDLIQSTDLKDVYELEDIDDEVLEYFKVSLKSYILKEVKG